MEVLVHVRYWIIFHFYAAWTYDCSRYLIKKGRVFVRYRISQALLTFVCVTASCNPGLRLLQDKRTVGKLNSLS